MSVRDKKDAQTKKATRLSGLFVIWLREPDLNRRPSGYEPDELPDCSIPRLWGRILQPGEAMSITWAEKSFFLQMLSRGLRCAIWNSAITKKATHLSGLSNWLREPDLNRRPSGYEPDELPDCSIPRGAFYSFERCCHGFISNRRETRLACQERRGNGAGESGEAAGRMGRGICRGWCRRAIRNMPQSMASATEIQPSTIIATMSAGSIRCFLCVIDHRP